MSDTSDARLDPTTVAVGDEGPTVTFADVSRVDIVKYAGASGDFNPNHVDETAARATGNDSVFAHGMFTAGVAAEFVADWLGIGRVTKYQIRFTDRVWPGDTIDVTGEVTDVDDTGDHVTVNVDLEVSTRDGNDVLIGSAVAQLPVDSS